MEPGKLVFFYRHESSLPMIFFGNRGFKIKSQFYNGDTIFCDATSSKIIVHHQVYLTAEETIISKLKFYMEAMGAGLPVESYSTDNGIYDSKEFTQVVARKRTRKQAQ